MTPSPLPTPPGDRLERALAAYLSAPPSTRGEGDALIASNPDLAELLQPMLGDGGCAEVMANDDARVLGDFRLVRELGRGGMGIVHEAWQRSLDRRVAVKVLSPALVANPAAVARFRREAAAAGRLRHPHIVEVFGFGSAGGEHFFAMQFVDGRPLHDVAADHRDPARATALAAQLADALQHAHAAGLVHRDVKPGNVLVRADGSVLLTDFGVARDEALPSLTRDGGFVGTLDYASPEQVRGEPVDARSDVWALGVILHELLSGSHPFTAATQQATLHRILTAEPPRLQGRTGISDDLAAVVDRALAKNRLHRYASAAALLADLHALQRGEGVSVRLPTGFERVQRWAAREPWRAFAAAVVLVAVPVLTGTLGYLWANAPRIEAATAAEARDRREEILSGALLTLQPDDDPQRGLDALHTLGTEDEEAAIVRALLLMRLERQADAHAALHGRSGAIVDLVHRYIDRPQSALELLDAVPDAFECAVRARVLYEAAVLRTGHAPQLLRRAVEMATTAVTLAPAPRLNYLITLASAAIQADDRVALATAVRGLEVHFGDSPTALEVIADAAVRRQPARALTLIDRVVAMRGDSADSRAKRALAFENMDRLDDAIAENRRAIAADPTYSMAWANLGSVLRKNKQLDEATEALREAVRLRPKGARYWNALGLVRRDARDHADAKRAFEHALELAPSYASAAYNLGNLLTRTGDHAGALAAFQKAVAADPQDVRAVANVSDALGRLGRHDEALPFALRASELAPGDLVPNFNVASLAVKLGLPKLALDYAERARRVSKDDPNALEVHARALLAQDPVDAESAKAALAAARTADERRKDRKLELRILVARALAATGDRDGAIDLLGQAKADPRFGKGDDKKEIDEQLAKLREPK